MLKQDEHLWRVGKWERLCTGCDSQQCWESNPDLSVDKYAKNLWTIEILYHVASATNMCARMFERLVLPMECWVKDCWCCEHIAAVLWYPSYQRSFVRNRLLWDRKRFRSCRHKLGIKVYIKWSTNKIFHTKYQGASTFVSPFSSFFFNQSWFLWYQKIDIIHIHQIFLTLWCDFI